MMSSRMIRAIFALVLSGGLLIAQVPVAYATEGGADDFSAESTQAYDGAAQKSLDPFLFQGVSVRGASGAETGSLHLGEAAVVSPVVQGAPQGTAYNYVWSRNGGWGEGEWSSTVRETGAPSAEASWEFAPSVSGRYDLYVDVVLPDGSSSTRSAVLLVEEEWFFDGVSASASRIDLGGSVSVSARVSGPDAAFARFNYVWSRNGGWGEGEWSSTVRETGAPSAEASWEFAPSVPGRYDLYVDGVRTDGSSETLGCAVAVVSEWGVEPLSVSSSRVALGEPVSLGLALSPGSNPSGLLHNFGWQYGDGWDLWDSVEKGGEPPVADDSWSFVLPRTGSYRLFADVVGADGRRETVSAPVEVVLPYEYEGVGVSEPSVTLGASVDVAAVVSGDPSGVSYNYVWSRNGSWEEGEWSSTEREEGAPTADPSWVFAPGRSGEYDLYVDVVAPDGTRQTRQASLEVRPGWEAGAVTTSLPSPQKVGAEVEVSVPVGGPRASEVSYNYVWSRNGSWEEGEWSSTEREEGAPTADPSWVFAPGRSGEYDLYVDVVDSLSGERETLHASFSVEKTWSLEGLDVSYSSPLRPGAEVTWTARVSGDAEGLRYNFVWDRNGWASWNSTLRHSGDYTSSSSVTYQVSSLSGIFGFYVDVVDANGETEQAQVTGVRGYSAEDNIALVSSIAQSQVGVSGGWKYEDALMSQGGYLCNGRRGWWCATYLWWCFEQAGLSSLWGTSWIESDPEYLAWQFDSLGRYWDGVAGVQPGDIIFSYWTPWRSGQNITHASYVLDVSNSYITVIEGNIGSAIGVRSYPKNWWQWRGYARPAY